MRALPLLSLVLAAALATPAVSHAQRKENGSVSVTVTDDSTGRPVRGARVRIATLSGHVVTGEDGTARLRNIPPGEHEVTISQVGYALQTRTVELDSGESEQLAVALEPQLEEVTLEGLAVTSWGRSVVLRGSGFYERQEIWHGTFLTGDEVMARAPHRLADLFRSLRGFGLRRIDSQEVLVTTHRFGRGGSFCTPKIMLNGVAMRGTPGDVTAHLAGINPAQVEGIEAYPSAAGLPTQYTGGETGCGLVLVWTRVK
jgi:hypothetical protein